MSLDSSLVPFLSNSFTTALSLFAIAKNKVAIFLTKLFSLIRGLQCLIKA